MLNFTLKRKLTSLLLVVVMLLSLCPAAVLADDTVSASPEQINVTVSFQDSCFMMAPQTMHVSADTAESYGFNLDEQSEHVTALDVLVAANKAYADANPKLGNFTEATAVTDEKTETTTYSNDLLTVQTSSHGAYITQLFGNATSNCGFTVNGVTPHDNVGKDVEGYEGPQYTGYAVNQAIVQNNDNVEFFIYQDTDFYFDYSAFFTDEDDNRLTTVTAAPNEKIVLRLQGYPIVWYGCSTDEVIAKHTDALTEFQLTLLDETGSSITNGEVAENILAQTTQEDGYCEVAFPENGTYYLSVLPLNEYADPIIYPWLEINVGAFEKASIPEYKNEVYEDFQNDLWLQYDFKELAVGESATIYPRRVPQIVKDDMTAASESDRPKFNFNIIEGDSVVLNTNNDQIEATVTAVKTGDTLVMVSYDETKAYDTVYGACSEVNYAYVVFSVNDENTPDIAISTNIPYSSYDTLYYTEGDGYDLDFTVTADGAAKVIVTVNGEEIASDEKDIYHALLPNRSNIIGVTAYDKNGNIRSFYQVIDARKIEITAVNGLDPKLPLTAGEPVNISFKGITMPVYKLSSIYNPSKVEWGGKGSYVHYTDTKGNKLKGYCKQYDLADNNTITFTPKTGGEYTLTNGQIFSSWWGSGLYADKGAYKPGWVGNAPINEGEFSVLPDITLNVEYDSQAVRVEGVSLNQTSATLKKGETLQLVATVTPENAQNKNVTWTLTNTATKDVESYYATIDRTGKITALNPTPSGTKLVATATTADGAKTASCEFTVKGSSTPSQKDKVNISIDTYTANNQSILDLTAINYQEGDTVWSATKRLLDEKGITYTYNPKKTGYVSEINGISEFDYGKESGWMYSVNGEYPEIGCGAYELKAGDTIRWRYTLNLGKDLGVTIPDTDNSTTGSGGGSGAAPVTTPETKPEQKPDTAAPVFNDVAKNAWYYTPVTSIAQKGLMTGTAANIFEPNKATTRAELVAILYRLENSPAVYAESTFSDVAQNAWYAAPIAWAENAKVVAGLDRTHFAPNNALTREQVAAILHNYAKLKGYDITQGGMAVREYADYDSISSYALSGMTWAVNTGIISGKDGNALDPQGTATRAEIAAMLERFIAFYKIS